MNFFYCAYIKRLIDVIVSLLGLFLLFFVFIIISFLIVYEDGLPIFYKQKRVGKDGKKFNIYKFRTMRNTNQGTSTITTVNDARVYRFGRYLRKFKIDEIPQLWNVFVGDMSLVGPRPDVPGYADKLIGLDRIVLSVRPGITGPATLAFREEEKLLGAQNNPEEYNDLVIYPQKVKLNVWYVQKMSFRLDLFCIIKTFIWGY